MIKSNFLKISTAILYCSLLTSSCKVDTKIPDISGTWILENDTNVKTVYTNNGIRKDYYNNELIDTYSYTITKSCGGNTAMIDSDYYIKNIDQEDGLDISCDFINGIGLNNNGNGDIILSITSETGKLFILKKQ